jgi:protein TonB
MALHALLMWQSQGVKSSPVPDTQIHASLRPAPPPPPAAAPQPPAPEPPVPEAKPEPRPEPKPPVPQAKPEPIKPVPERTVPLRPDPKTPAPESKAAAAPPQPEPVPAKPPASEASKSDAKTDVAKAPAAAPSAPGPAAADDDLRAVVGNYENQLAQKTQDRLRYPAPARDQGWGGVATVRVRIDEKGYIISIDVLNSTGYEILDAQAKIAAEKAKPLVQVPPALRGKAFDARIRVVFKLEDKAG